MWRKRDQQSANFSPFAANDEEQEAQKNMDTFDATVSRNDANATPRIQVWSTTTNSRDSVEFLSVVCRQ